MKITEIRELSAAELNEKLADCKKELFNLRFQLATGQLQNTMQIGECKKNIARVNTVIRMRQLDAQAR